MDYVNACSLLLPSGRHTLIDADDFDRVAGVQWYVITTRKTGRSSVIAPTKAAGRPAIVYLHRLLTDAPAGLLVDHQNHDTLDNRKANLRLCTKSQNAANSRPQRTKTRCPYKGVYRVSRLTTNPWQAYVYHHKKRKHLGYHATPELAAAAYNIAAREIYGEFALLNPV